MAALLIGLGGCVGIPTSGAIHLGRAVTGANNPVDDDIRVFPAPPRPGMSPVSLVTSFLQASVASDNGYSIAREYLAAGVNWRPSQSLTIYDNAALAVSRVRDDRVRVRAPRVGVVNATGEYADAPGTVHAQLSVVRQDGQWRISRLPSQVLLSTVDAQRSLRPATIYFLDVAQNRLVPDLLLLNVEPSGLATTLVRTLLAGPGQPLAAAVRSAVPPDTQLLGNVPITGSGTAQINLPPSARQLPPQALARLSAQLVWTLRQLSGIDAIQLLADGRPLSAPGVASLQRITAWQSFDPDASSRVTPVLDVRGNRVAAIAGTVPAALAARRGLSAPAITLDDSRVAALRTTNRGPLLVTGPSGGPLSRPLREAVLAGPAFDGADGVLVVVAGPLGERIVRVSPQGSVRPVPAPASLLTAPIDALRVSRDGARIALITGPVGRRSLLVGELAPDKDGLSIVDPHAVLGPQYDASGLAWTTSGQVVTTGVVSRGLREVYTSDVDGYAPQQLSDQRLPAGVSQVAAAPGQPVIATNGAGVWTLVGQTWTRTSTGAEPTYPG